MRKNLSFSKQLDAPASQIWHLITDTRSWPEWGPSVKAFDCDQRCITAGSVGRIQTAAGIWPRFAIAAFEPDSYWDWRVGGLFATGHRVESMGPGGCKLAFTVPVCSFGYGLVCHLALLRIDRLLMGDQKAQWMDDRQTPQGDWGPGIPFFQALNALAHLDTAAANRQCERAFNRLVQHQEPDGGWGQTDRQWNTFLAVHALKNKGMLPTTI